MSVDLGRLVELVEAFPKQTILVFGDLVADEFVFGEISRVSREAPVLILRHRQTELVPGGGANAANNLCELGARVLPVGAVGDDAAGDALIEYFRRKNVSTSGIVRARGWTTTVKSRFLAGWTHTARQQVLRLDRAPDSPPPAAARKEVERRLRARLGRAGAVLVSDYGSGVVTPEAVRKLRAPRVTLDSRYALLDFARCGIAAATPNEPELEALYHTRIGTNQAQLEKLGARTLTRMQLGALLVTRGKDGMTLFERGRRPAYIPIYGSDQVTDVTGAGDTVIAAFTLALAAGASYLEAAHLANYAGGIVVMKRGTATVSRDELLAALRGEATGQSAPVQR
jgi:rfaE bifunctional protein kinase chain/domain